MPELPEVETIKNALQPYLTGRTFKGIKISDTRPVQKLTLDEFCGRLMGKKILGLDRRGKFLIIRLSDGENLVIHLRMTGALLWNPSHYRAIHACGVLFRQRRTSCIYGYQAVRDHVPC